MRESQKFGLWLEVVSYGMVVLIGLFLAWRGGWRLLAAREATVQDHCCHGHGASSEELQRPLSAGQFVLMVVSIGIRPCSGAILVLALAFAMQQLAAGTAAVLAMSLGTGLSIAGLAALSVYARKGAIALSAALDHRGAALQRLLDGAAVIGGLLIALFGVALLQGALAVTSHPLL